MVDRRMFKGLNVLRIGHESIKIELNLLDSYIDDTANTLASKQQELENQYKEARATDPKDEAEIDMYFSDEFHRYHELFPTFAFNSILVSQFSFFETRLKFLCELYERNSFSKVKVNDLNGSDIEKCKRYLILVAEINFDDFQEMWKRITDIQKLRNAIIHNSSKIMNEKANDSLVNFIKADNRIEYTEQNESFYINDVSFLKEFSKLLLSFFKILVNKLSGTNVIVRNRCDH